MCLHTREYERWKKERKVVVANGFDGVPSLGPSEIAARLVPAALARLSLDVAVVAARLESD